MKYTFAIRLVCLVAFINLAFVGNAFAFITVGLEHGCSFSDLQQAIDSNVSNEIRVIQVYHGKPIKFSNRSLKIFGGYTDCTGTTQAPGGNFNFSNYSVIDGSMDTGTKPVLQIDGQSTLDLRNFIVEFGHNSGNAGGGIRFFSSGSSASLDLTNVVISSNRADLGGGIFYNGGATTSDRLVFHEETVIENNTADHAGGGIRLEGRTRLIAESPQTWINGNTANPNFSDDGRGGGLQLLDGSTAVVGSPGYNGVAVINGNSARYGGGISLHDATALRLFTTQTGHPARVENNSALVNGGGVYLHPQSAGLNGGGAIPTLCGFGYGINHNRAASGAAIYDDDDGSFSQPFGGFVDLTRQSCNGFPPEQAACVNGIPCNTIDDNTATQNNGSVLHTGGEIDAQLHLEDVEIRRNTGNHLMDLMGGGTVANDPSSLSNCLIVENNLSGAGSMLIDATRPPMTIDGCTIANNTSVEDEDIFFQSDLTLTHSILWRPGKSMLVGNASTHTVEFIDVIVSDADTLAGSAGTFDAFTNVHSLDPQFIDPAGDYHLKSTSPAIDYAVTGIANDLDGNARGKVLRNAATPFDIGAYERQTLTAVTFPPSETFEETDSTAVELPFGWNNTITNDTGTTQGWVITNSGQFNGGFAVHADDPEGVTDATLDTAIFNVRFGQISFEHSYNLDFFDNTAFDGVVLELSIDSGPFVDFLAAGGSFVSGGYNAVISSDWSSPIAGRPAWSGNSVGYRKVIANLPAAANGHPTKVRWRLSSDVAGSAPGYWLDDIHLVVDTIFRDGFGQ